MDERNDIAGIIGALAVHVDARQWPELLLLFAPEVHVDYTSLFGGEPQAMSREDLIAGWQRLLPGFTRTTHLIGPPSITVSDQTAHAAASVVAWHFIEDAALGDNDLWLVGGCYEIGFRKLYEVWRITDLRLIRAWAKGNLDLPKIASQRATTSPSGTK